MTSEECAWPPGAKKKRCEAWEVTSLSGAGAGCAREKWMRFDEAVRLQKKKKKGGGRCVCACGLCGAGVGAMRSCSR